MANQFDTVREVVLKYAHRQLELIETPGYVLKEGEFAIRKKPSKF